MFVKRMIINEQRRLSNAPLTFILLYLVLSGIEEFCLDIATELRRTVNEIYVRISSIHEIDLTESQVCLIDMALYRRMSKKFTSQNMTKINQSRNDKS